MSAGATAPARRRGEEGAATVVVCALLGVLLLLAGACGVVAAVFADHRRAQAAADLAALSGAVVHQRGQDACTEAASVAGANGATLTACRVERYDVLVTAEVAGPRWLGFAGDPVAHARAGPDQ